MRYTFTNRTSSVLALAVILLLISTSVFASDPQCSGCHASMADTPKMLPETPPADLIEALMTPCYNYGRVLEEYYSVDELFVTIEHHIEALEADRYHVHPLLEELEPSRNYFRVIKNEPLVSLTDFRMKSGKLRFDLGKTYRIVKEHRIDQRSRDVLGFFMLGTIFLLILVVTGWRVSSGSGLVHSRKTNLGYDDVMEQGGIEKILEENEAEKEDKE